MSDIIERAKRFRALHERNQPLLLPNPWDPGTARLLTHLGFEALGTTSLGVANMLGRRRAGGRELLDNCGAIVAATDLPISADLENGFGDAPEDAARAITAAWERGAVGGSIEDGTYDPRRPVYDFTLAVERVAAAVEAARALPAPFVLTARAESLFYGDADLDAVIRRLQAFEAAGAGVLYAPGLRTLEQMRTVVSAVRRPVNVVMGFADPSITLAQLAEVGVRRVSIGGALSRLALRAFLDGAAAMRAGRFAFVRDIVTIDRLYEAFPS
ncbi:MAG TPA: isocitrate lyase/phosphoenolpyruvate mutase family protein [Candidatus Binatia bacterium]|jgi:2-methylisocitrate lyase-like PEP mutase family enzyme